MRTTDDENVQRVFDVLTRASSVFGPRDVTPAVVAQRTSEERLSAMLRNYFAKDLPNWDSPVAPKRAVGASTARPAGKRSRKPKHAYTPN
jgi:hypothetical protein